MPSILDIRTLCLTGAIVGATYFGYMLHWRFTHKTYPGFGLWTGSAAAGLVGLVLILLRGVVPDLLSVVLTNILLVLDFALICLGLAIFSGQRVLWWFETGIIAGLGTLAAWFTYAQPNVPWRILIFSLAMSFYCLRAAWVAWRLPAGGVPRSWILLAALMGVGLFFLAGARSGHTPLGGAPRRPDGRRHPASPGLSGFLRRAHPGAYRPSFPQPGTATG